jgi:hypothetical protein
VEGEGGGGLEGGEVRWVRRYDKDTSGGILDGPREHARRVGGFRDPIIERLGWGFRVFATTAAAPQRDANPRFSCPFRAELSTAIDSYLSTEVVASQERRQEIRGGAVSTPTRPFPLPPAFQSHFCILRHGGHAAASLSSSTSGDALPSPQGTQLRLPDTKRVPDWARLHSATYGLRVSLANGERTF